MHRLIGRTLSTIRSLQPQSGNLLIETVLLLLGPSRLTPSRRAWIFDFLALATSCIGGVVPVEIAADDTDVRRLKPAKRLLVTHELPDDLRDELSSKGWKYIDIRVSPVRFLENDFLFAIGTNDIKLRSRLNAYRLSDDRIRAEANFLMSSFRYRKFGCVNIDPNSIAIFLEKEPDVDSVNWLVNTSLRPHVERLKEIRGQYSKMYFVVPPARTVIEDLALASDLKAEILNENCYAVLASKHTKAIAACRSGILEEAFYFGKSRVILDQVSTPVCDASDHNSSFYNIVPTSLLSASFWRHLIHGMVPRTEPVVPSRDLLRRAVNDWGSYAAVRAVGTKEFYEVIQLPSLELFRAVVTATSAILEDTARTFDFSALSGRWHWFTGNVVEIFRSGLVFSNDDVGYLRVQAPNSFHLRWCRGDLSDFLELSNDSFRLNGRNQYGAAVTARRVL